MTEQSSALFKPMQLGPLTLRHRLVLAPLTRLRASDDHVPLPFVATYYAQRGCVPGTLLITEATFISPRGAGYANIPGIWTKAQIDGWKVVTDKVHEQGSYIFCQLWALGRAADPQVVRDEFGMDIVSASDVPMPASARVGNPAPPRPMTDEEIQALIADYAQAATNAMAAGFDGVEIHGANGYMVDQFIQDVTNKRTDAWGGSVEKRSRFALEVAKACAEAVGKDRVGMRLSPYSTFQGMKMDDPAPTYKYLCKALGELGIAYMHVVESRVSGSLENEDKAAAAERINFTVDAWRSAGNNQRPVLLAGGYKPETARKCADEEYKDQNIGVVFGRLFISNPDLVFRLKRGIELTQYNRETFYTIKSENGYTDYPFSKEFRATDARILSKA